MIRFYCQDRAIKEVIPNIGLIPKETQKKYKRVIVASIEDNHLLIVGIVDGLGWEYSLSLYERLRLKWWQWKDGRQ